MNHKKTKLSCNYGKKLVQILYVKSKPRRHLLCNHVLFIALLKYTKTSQKRRVKAYLDSVKSPERRMDVTFNVLSNVDTTSPGVYRFSPDDVDFNVVTT